MIGFARLGLLADLLSKPIRVGFMNAIALTVLIGQLPKLFGFSVKADDLPEKTLKLVQGIADGRTNAVALLIGAGSLALILLLKAYRPKWPGILIAVALATVAVEAAHPDFWRKYVGRTGVVVGIASFGESAPAKDLYQHFGITSARVCDAVRTLVHRAAHRREQALPEHIVPGTH